MTAMTVMTASPSPSHTRRDLLRMGTGLLAGTLGLQHLALARSSPQLPRVQLQDQDSRTLWLPDAFAGARTVLVSFFFTGCQTVCPPQTALLREAHRLLRERGHARGLRLLALSVDPLADGPAQLRDYARRFELPLARGTQDGWLLLTGARAEMARALAAFGVPKSAPGEHPSLLWVADPARSRWTRSSSLNPPEALARLVEAMHA